VKPISADTIAAYKSTRFEVTLPNGAVAVVKVGQPLPAALKAAIGEGHSVSIVTAWNPFSTMLKDDANESRNTALKSDLSRRGLQTLPAIGRDAHSPWSELSFAVLDVDRASLNELLVTHEQNAVVHVPAGGLAALVFHPRATFDSAS
jgi:hypothetical protein